jgi:pimeloyl-ACP methyl ester carboxylesterase
LVPPAIRYEKTIDGLHIAYQVVGEGPVDLVYAPGWFSNLEAVWEVPDLGDFLGELASAFRLILLDRRGFGLSDWPITSGSLSLELGMDDIRAVMDAAGSERAVLFGFDEGGALCTLFAASYPERVSALVLFAVWAKYYASSDYPWGWTTDEAEEWWQLIDRHLGEPSASGRRTAPSSTRRFDATPSASKRGLATPVCRPLQVLL